MGKPKVRTVFLWIYLVVYWFSSIGVLVYIDLNYRQDFLYHDDLVKLNCEGSQSICIVKKATPEDVKRHLGYETVNFLPGHQMPGELYN